MANTKMTQRDYFNEIIALASDNGRDDLVEFAKGRIAVLDKKNENRKPTKTQAENEVLKDKVVEVLGNIGNKVTVSEVLSADGSFTGLSNQKMSAMLRALVADGKVVKSTDKGKSYFSLA